MANYPPTPRNFKTMPYTLYETQFYHHSTSANHEYIFITKLTLCSINAFTTNSLLHPPLPAMHSSEASFPREGRGHLARLRYGHHSAFLNYQKRLKSAAADACLGCSTMSHMIKQVMKDCTAYDYICQQHNVRSLYNLWESLVSAVASFRT